MGCLRAEDLDRLFRVEHFLKNVDFIFDRVFGKRRSRS
jgi:hypothetical protein